jgi:hypothetical protein
MIPERSPDIQSDTARRSECKSHPCCNTHSDHRHLHSLGVRQDIEEMN